MNRFEKVSFKQFYKDLVDCIGDVSESGAMVVYEKIELPTRSTKGSAGYDFKLPYPINMKPGDTLKIPTGIRVQMDSDKVLMIYPRSSLGFKYKMQLVNTTGIVDFDYFFADNKGHIFAKIYNQGDKEMNLSQGDKFMQGILSQYFLMDDDSADGVRTGGIGSTGA